MTNPHGTRIRVDSRTRSIGASTPIVPAAFWDEQWKAAIARNGARATEDAHRLGLPPIAITVDAQTWTMRVGEQSIEVISGRDLTTPRVTLDRDAFCDLVSERRTSLGLIIGARVAGDPVSNE